MGPNCDGGKLICPRRAYLEAENDRLRAALQMWVDYDNLDEADFSEAGPMLHYAEAIEKARHLLNPSK